MAFVAPGSVDLTSFSNMPARPVYVIGVGMTKFEKPGRCVVPVLGPAWDANDSPEMRDDIPHGRLLR